MVPNRAKRLIFSFTSSLHEEKMLPRGSLNELLNSIFKIEIFFFFMLQRKTNEKRVYYRFDSEDPELNIQENS